MKITYPKRLFKSKKDAMRSVERELDLMYGPSFLNMPKIESVEWRFEEGAKSGRWHYIFSGLRRFVTTKK